MSLYETLKCKITKHRKKTMAKKQIKAVRGTNDITPENIAGWHFIEKKAREIFSNYGYGEMRTPIFELTELFEKNIGETTEIVEKEMYSFSDKKGRNLSLRPEGTASIVRAYNEHNYFAQGGMQKFYYIGPMFRYERPQEGRSRQFHQIGVEAIGTYSPNTDFELICLLHDFLTAIGLKQFSINLNNVGTPECKQAYTEKLRTYLAPLKDQLCPDCVRRLDTNPLRVLDCKVPSCKQATTDVPLLKDSLNAECLERFATIQRLLDNANIPYTLNDKLVRGLDYYTETVFEVSCPLLGAKDAIAGGGRYNNLVENLGGKPAGAAGFGLGMERILLALGKEDAMPASPVPDVFVAYTSKDLVEKAMEIALLLRRQGVKTEIMTEPRALKAQFKAANASGARFMAIAGQEEIEAGQVKIKEMESGSESMLDLDQIQQWAQKL